jgi:hypothetical protein
VASLATTSRDLRSVRIRSVATAEAVANRA